MNILIVSGFLGAGKTTFIKKLSRRIVGTYLVLENEYADINIDKDILGNDEITTWSISDGCICCSMLSDFRTSIRNIYNDIDPDYLIIEPTGIGSLSTIIRSLGTIKDVPINILNPVTMVDVNCFYEYKEEFGNLYLDQIANAHQVLLTKLEDANKNLISEIKKEIELLNKNLIVVDKEYRFFDDDWWKYILNDSMNKDLIDFKLEIHPELKTYSLTNLNITDMEEFGKFMHKLLRKDYGKVYRGKGFLKINGYWGEFELVNKNFEMYPTAEMKESKIILIGKNLDEEKLNKALKKD